MDDQLELLNKIAQAKWDAMDLVKKVSANNRLTAFKIKQTRICLKKMLFAFEKMEDWGDDPSIRRVCQAAREEILRVLKEIR